MLFRAVVRAAAGARHAALTRSPLLSTRIAPAAPAIWMCGMAKQPPNRSQNSLKFKTKIETTSSSPPIGETPTEAALYANSAAPLHPPQYGPRRGASANELPSQPASRNTEEDIPDLSKLPDLTQGIPSTLEHETTGSTARCSVTAYEEETDSSGRGSSRKKGDLPASAYVSSSEKRRARLANVMFFALVGGLVVGSLYLGRNLNEEEAAKHPNIENGWGTALWWNRVKARFGSTLDYYKEPAFEKLLPDPHPSFERPYTLCISLDDMLIHSEWSREYGWRLAKRPGVDYFLRYLSQYYEIVLFTTVPWTFGDPLVRKLDPYRLIMWPLYREATKFQDGEIVKDLSYLNRDLSKVIIIDTDPKHVRAQPENAIVLPKWKGDPKDKELVSLVPFLEYICAMNYPDVRKVIKSFDGKHIPTEFARREALARAEFNHDLEKRGGPRKNPAVPGGMGYLASLLGMKPSNMNLMVIPNEDSPEEALAKGKMIHDVVRERGRKNYEMLEKEIKENGEKWLKEEQEMQKKMQKEAMKDMTSSFGGWFGPFGGKDKGAQKPLENGGENA